MQVWSFNLWKQSFLVCIDQNSLRISTDNVVVMATWWKQNPRLTPMSVSAAVTSTLRKEQTFLCLSVLSHKALVGYGCHGNAAADRSGCGSEEQSCVCFIWQKKKLEWMKSLSGWKQTFLHFEAEKQNFYRSSTKPRPTRDYNPSESSDAAGAEIYIFPDICMDSFLLCIQFQIEREPFLELSQWNPSIKMEIKWF